METIVGCQSLPAPLPVSGPGGPGGGFPFRGGGHARVGAISFEVTQGEAAHKAALDIAEELRASVRQQKT